MYYTVVYDIYMYLKVVVCRHTGQHVHHRQDTLLLHIATQIHLTCYLFLTAQLCGVITEQLHTFYNVHVAFEVFKS